jgi:hypothetical protein
MPCLLLAATAVMVSSLVWLGFKRQRVLGSGLIGNWCTWLEPLTLPPCAHFIRGELALHSEVLC